MGRDPKQLRHVRSHFKRRLKERYGIHINSQRYKELLHDVWSGDPTRAEHVWTESNTRSHFIMDIDGEEVLVVYDKTVNGLSTALPPDELDRYYRL